MKIGIGPRKLILPHLRREFILPKLNGTLLSYFIRGSGACVAEQVEHQVAAILMAYGSDFHEPAAQGEKLARPPFLSVSTEAVPYILSTADAFVIVLSSILSGVGYQLATGNPVPDVLPHCAVGLLASFIYV